MSVEESPKDPGVELENLASFVDELLGASEWEDYGPNGVQVEGRSPIRQVVTGVSACAELFERAAALEADAILVHHGLFWNGMPRTLTGLQYRRVRALIDRRMSLLAYHLPLDAHAEIGNNALGAQQLGLVERQPFGSAKGRTIGFQGRFDPPLSMKALEKRCEGVFGQAPMSFAAGPTDIRTLGIISGGAQGELYQAIDAGLDAYLTGEVSEWVMNVARESGIHYLAAGHYATERLGIRALGERLARHFGITATFVDVPNPV